jgi:LmbE family N-acetylglucosaminyl deacetylase
MRRWTVAGRFRRAWRYLLPLLLVGATAGLLDVGLRPPGRTTLPSSRPAARSTARGDDPLPIRRPRPGERIVVFAVHPDDEIVGAGAYLAAAHRAVLVVYLTRGEASSSRRLETGLGPRDRAASLGRRRHGEARRGLEHLRLPSGAHRHLVLRLPDARLDALLSADERPRAAVRVFLRAVRRILRREHPDVVLIPSVYDRHPDHAAAAVVLALVAADAGIPAYAYLVHWPFWPIPGGYAPEHRLRPPASLRTAGITWFAVPLTATERRRLLHALYHHGSQLRLLAPYLLAFLRANGLLAVTAPLGEGTAIREPDGTLWGRRGGLLYLRQSPPTGGGVRAEVVWLERDRLRRWTRSARSQGREQVVPLSDLPPRLGPAMVRFEGGAPTRPLTSPRFLPRDRTGKATP